MTFYFEWYDEERRDVNGQAYVGAGSEDSFRRYIKKFAPSSQDYVDILCNPNSDNDTLNHSFRNLYEDTGIDLYMRKTQ